MSFVPADPENVAALRRSEMLVGQLDEAIVDENGQPLSGGNRLIANKNWRTRKVKVQNSLHRDVLKLSGNIRRTVSEEETRYRLRRIGDFLVQKGLPQSWLDGTKPMTFLEKFPEDECVPIPPEKISSVMFKLLEGIYKERHIRNMLPPEYKETKFSHVSDVEEAPVPPDHLAEKATQLKTGLSGLEESALPSLEVHPIMEGCLCPQCPNKHSCGML